MPDCSGSKLSAICCVVVVRRHNHFAIHDEPVAGERAKEWVAARFFRSVEINNGFVLWQHDVRVEKNVVCFRNVMPHSGFRIGDQLVGQLADSFECSRLEQAQLCGTTSGLDNVNSINSPGRTLNDRVAKDRLPAVSIVTLRPPFFRWA